MPIICGNFKRDILILCSNKKKLNFNQVKDWFFKSNYINFKLIFFTLNSSQGTIYRFQVNLAEVGLMIKVLSKVVKIKILERNGKPFIKSDRKNGT